MLQRHSTRRGRRQGRVCRGLHVRRNRHNRGRRRTRNTQRGTRHGFHHVLRHFKDQVLVTEGRQRRMLHGHGGRRSRRHSTHRRQPTRQPRKPNRRTISRRRGHHRRRHGPQRRQLLRVTLRQIRGLTRRVHFLVTSRTPRRAIRHDRQYTNHSSQRTTRRHRRIRGGRVRRRTRGNRGRIILVRGL